MKKIKTIIQLLFGLLLFLCYWIMEPSSINPFNETPFPFSQSISTLKSTRNSQLLKLKADSVINNAVLLNDFVGLSAAVSSELVGTYVSSAGYANKGGKIMPNKDTQFRIASISKPFTAVAIMQLYEQEKINLDLPIQEYLPEFPISPKGDITIRHLLKHTSGIPHYTSTWDVVSFTNYKSSVAAIDEFKHRELSFEPGTAYEYTTYGYTVLGAIIEKVTGLSYKEYMSKHIFKPANMMNTTIEESAIVSDNKANLYIKWGRRFIKSPNTDLSVKAPGGGIISTAEDLVKFGKSILENSLIDSITLELMVNATDTLREGVSYGFGWFVREDSRHGQILEHGGSQSGASSFFRIYLDQGFAIATIANNFNSDNEMYFLSRDLTEVFLNDNKRDEPVNYYRSQNQSVLEQYVGAYEFDGQVLSISKEGDQLFAQTNPYPKTEIYPRSQYDFFYRIFDGKLKFNVEDKEALSVQYKGQDDTKLYERIGKI